MEFLTKNWKLIILVVSILSLTTITIWSNRRYESTLNDWKIAVANEKAYVARIDELSKSNQQFQFTIDQLKYSNDSIIQHLMKAKSDLKVKDKNIKELQYMYSTFKSSDTITLTDTIFIKDFDYDTIVGDDWMHSHIHLKYPGLVGLETCVKSKKDVVISAHKETVNPPKKFFIWRWFQKKHEIVKVDVLEENPHIQSEDNVFIRVLN